MNIPQNIFAEISCKSCNDLSDIIVQLKVKAGRKNHYHIYFSKTNSSGKTSLNIDDFIGQFKDHWELGLMDYDGTPESANPVVEISLFDPTWLIENKKLAMAWPLLKHEKTKWINRQQQYEYMTRCRNRAFGFQSKDVDLSETDRVILEVFPKG
jgi:hypothetical protein